MGRAASSLLFAALWAPWTFLQDQDGQGKTRRQRSSCWHHAPAPFLSKQKVLWMHLAESSNCFQRACPRSSHARTPNNDFVCWKKMLLRIWQRLVELLKQYVQHKGWFSAVQWGDCSMPLYKPRKIIFQKLQMVSLADLASSSGEHSHVQKDRSSPEAYGARKNHL